MAAVVLTKSNKYSFPNGEWAQINDGHLIVHNDGSDARSILAIFAPGEWTQYVVSGESSALTDGSFQMISVDDPK